MRSGRISTVRVIAVLALVAYVVAALAFAFRSVVVGSRAQESPQAPIGGVAVTVELRDFDPERQDLTAAVQVDPGAALLSESERLAAPLSVTIGPASDPTEISFEGNDLAATSDQVIFLPGTIENYPFDAYSDAMEVNAYWFVDDAWQTIPVAVGVDASALTEWWHVGESVAASSGDGEAAAFTIGVSRTISTRIFALLIAGLLGAIALIALIAVRNVASGRRAQDLSMTDWFAALLFAIVPLRLALPGSPPIGVWLDVLVFFWAVAVVMLSLLWWIKIWIDRGPPGAAETRASDAAP